MTSARMKTFLKIGMDDANTLGTFIPLRNVRHELPALLRWKYVRKPSSE